MVLVSSLIAHKEYYWVKRTRCECIDFSMLGTFERTHMEDKWHTISAGLAVDSRGLGVSMSFLSLHRYSIFSLSGQTWFSGFSLMWQLDLKGQSRVLEIVAIAALALSIC